MNRYDNWMIKNHIIKIQIRIDMIIDYWLIDKLVWVLIKINETFVLNLQTLYKLGARRIMVSSIGPLGCVPSVLLRSTNGSCDHVMQDAAAEFDKQLEELRTQFPSAKFLFATAFHGQSEFMTNPKAFGMLYIPEL